MRIFIISGGYPSGKYYGNHLFEFDQARALADRGHQIVLLALDLRSIRRWRHWLFESLEINNVSIEAFNFPLGPMPQWLLTMFGRIGLRVLYHTCIKKFGKPDIIHAHFTDMAYIAVKTLKNHSVPIVMTEHSSGINKESIDRSLYAIAEYSYHAVSEVISVSPALQHRIKRVFGIESTYIPNVLDLGVFNYEESQTHRGTFLIVSVGNLIPLKRMHRLLDGFSQFVKLKPDSQLIIYGEGPERARLELQISELGLEGKVYLKGKCPRKEIAKSLHDASCFVLVSSSETFGVSYIEALACGVPVIATKCGGPEGFVHEGNGLLIPVDDEEALLQALDRMYRTYEDYDRKSIANEVVLNFSPNSITRQLDLVYQRVAYE